MCLVHLGHNYLFHRVSSFSAVSLPERVNEVAPSLLLVLFGSCLSVIQRTQSPLTELLLELSLPFPFVPSPLLGAPIAGLTSRFLILKKKLDFASRDVFGTSTSICKSRMCCRQKWSLEHKLETSISILRNFQHASHTDPPIYCQRVCP